MKKARKYGLSARVYSRLEVGPEKEDGFSEYLHAKEICLGEVEGASTKIWATAATFVGWPHNLYRKFCFAK